MKVSQLIEASQIEAAEAALQQARAESAKEKDPLILKVLTGISAWVASLFLLGFIFVALSPEEEHILWLGVITSGLAILLHRTTRGAGIFIEQSTLSCMMCGHIMLLAGALIHFDYGDEFLTLAIAQTLLCALPIWVFKRSTYQASTLLLAACFWTIHAVDSNAPWLFRLLLAIEVSAFGALAIWRARRDSFTYALALVIGATLIFLDWAQSLPWQEKFDEALWPSNLILAALTAVAGAHFVPQANRTHPKTLCLFALLLALAFLSSPGLLYAMTLLMLGFGLRDTIFGGLGLIGLPIFLIYFYYSLQVSLLEKSGILFASGMICFSLAYLAQRSLTKHSKTEVNP